MRKYLLMLLLLGTQFCGLPLYAQKKAKNAVAKEIAAEQKRLETEGWKLWNSNETWQELLTKKYAMQSEQMVDGDGEKSNRYIICTASASHRSLNMAMQLAETKAKSDIASKQKTEVDVTTVQMNKTKTADSDIVDLEETQAQPSISILAQRCVRWRRFRPSTGKRRRMCMWWKYVWHWIKNR